MISRLTGVLISVHDGVALLDVDGVGYDIFVNEADSVGTVPHVSFYTHCHCPQDSAMQLFGFRTIDDRKLFRRLIDIDGVGPGTAMRIVNAVVHCGTDPRSEDMLKQVRGVGPKLAERIAEVFNA